MRREASEATSFSNWSKKWPYLIEVSLIWTMRSNRLKRLRSSKWKCWLTMWMICCVTKVTSSRKLTTCLRRFKRFRERSMTRSSMWSANSKKSKRRSWTKSRTSSKHQNSTTTRWRGLRISTVRCWWTWAASIKITRLQLRRILASSIIWISTCPSCSSSSRTQLPICQSFRIMVVCYQAHKCSNGTMSICQLHNLRPSLPASASTTIQLGMHAKLKWPDRWSPLSSTQTNSISRSQWLRL